MSDDIYDPSHALSLEDDQGGWPDELEVGTVFRLRA